MQLLNQYWRDVSCAFIINIDKIGIKIQNIFVRRDVENVFWEMSTILFKPQVKHCWKYHP